MADQDYHEFLFNISGPNVEAATFNSIYEEVTHLFGTDLVYIKRTLAQEEVVFGEFLSKISTEGIDIRLFIEQVEQFDGAGDLFSKFGLQLSDEMTVYGPKIAFTDKTILPKPQDLILHVPSSKLFEITHVQDDRDGAPFYPLGDKDFGYKLTCKIYNHDYSEIAADVGVPEIVDLDDMNDIDIADHNDEITAEGASYIDTSESDPIND